MKKIKIVELFGGIGAPRAALRNLGYNVESTYIEFDQHAVNSYNSMYNENNTKQDVSTFSAKSLKGEVDVLIGGFPCQDLSNAGLQKGMSETSETRSSLVWQMVRTIEECEPNQIVIENVKALLNKTFKSDFELLIKKLEQLGYNVSYKVLNSLEYGIPQQRERVFIVCTKDKTFNFNNLKTRELQKLTDIIDFDDESEVLSEERIEAISNWNAYEKPLTKIMTKDTKYVPTLTTRGNFMMTSSIKLLETKNKKIRPITPSETVRLMGFTEEDYKNMTKVSSKNQIGKQAGNSIVVQVMEVIFEELLKGEQC